MEVCTVALGRLVHVGGRLKREHGLLSPLLSVVFLERVALPEDGVDMETSIDRAKVDQVLGGQILLRVVRALRLTFVIHFSCNANDTQSGEQHKIACLYL